MIGGNPRSLTPVQLTVLRAMLSTGAHGDGNPVSLQALNGAAVAAGLPDDGTVKMALQCLVNRELVVSGSRGDRYGYWLTGTGLEWAKAVTA